VITDEDENSYLLTLTYRTEERGKKRVTLLSGERKKKWKKVTSGDKSPL
jgi:hypothetical protein